MKRYIGVMTLCLALLMILAACGGESSDTTGEDMTPIDVETVSVIENGASEYAIVRSDTEDNGAIAGISALYGGIHDVTGVKLTLKTDFVKEGTKYVEQECEILLGMTNRPASAGAKALLDEVVNEDTEAYLVYEENKKIVIMGSSEMTLEMAIDYFLKTYVKSDGIQIPKGLRDVQIFDVRAYWEEHWAQYSDKMAGLNTTAFRTEDFGKVVTFNTKAYAAPPYTPETGVHPRVLFTDATKETIKQNFTATENATAYRAYLALSELPVETILGTEDLTVFNPETKRLTFNSQHLSAIEAKAFRYAMTGEESFAYEAIFAIKAYIMTITFEGTEGTRTMGVVMLTAATVYDWCYDLLSEDDKQCIVAGVQNLVAKDMEIGFPPSGQRAVSGHGSEAQLLRDWLAFAIAVADEYPDIYQFVAGRFFAQFVPVRNYYYQSGTYMQGSGYGPYRFGFDLWSAWLIKTFSGVNPYNEADMERVVMTYTAYVRPDNQSWRIGDDTGERRSSYNFGSYARDALIAATMFGNTMFKGEAKTRSNNFGSDFYSDSDMRYVHFLIFNDPSLGTTGIETMPLVTYNGSPVGQMFTRTAWNDPGAVAVYMKIGELWGANHEHKDCGTFMIFYKGILASDSGYYENMSGEFTHENTYARETIAHNGLLIKDAANAGTDRGGSGGQKHASETNTLESWLTANYQRATILGSAHGYGKDGELLYAYLGGDITKAYSSQVSEVLRSMISFYTEDEKHPMVFFTYDKITATKATNKKTFLLHMQMEPTVDGNKTIIKNTLKGNNGMLVNQTLSPVDYEISKIGGPGREFEVNGVNHPLAGRFAVKLAEVGWGRVEISPKSQNLTDTFLNAMYVTDADNTEAIPEAVTVTSDKVEGAKLLGCVATFSKTKARINTTVQLTVPGNESSLVYGMTGMAEGKWSVSVNGQFIGDFTATAEGGMLYFTAPAGQVTITFAG